MMDVTKRWSSYASRWLVGITLKRVLDDRSFGELVALERERERETECANIIHLNVIYWFF